MGGEASSISSSGTLGQLREELICCLGGWPGLQGVGVRQEYPPGGREHPLQRPVVAVGWHSAGLQPGGMGGYMGWEANGRWLQGGMLSLVARLDIYSPAEAGGGRCHEIYEQLMACLLLGQRALPVAQIRCGQLGTLTGSPILHLAGYAKLEQVALATPQLGQAVEEIVWQYRPEEGELL